MEEGVPPFWSPLQAELQSLKISDLKKRAVCEGVDAESLCKADDDQDNVKSVVIGLILAHKKAKHVAELQKQLGNMKLSALKQHAAEVGVDKQKLIESDDAENVKETVVALIAEAVSEQPTIKVDKLGKLRAQLSVMKVSELKRKAAATGVDQQRLDDADDAADVRGTVIDLIIEMELAQEESKTDAIERRLRNELSSVQKVSILKKRAIAVGVDAERLLEADDAEDVKTCVINLIIENTILATNEEKTTATTPVFPGVQPEGAYEEPTRTAPATRPHFGIPAHVTKTGSTKIAKPFGKRHVMLSYNWAHQQTVKRAHDLLVSRGIPAWMDIDGGISSDIYDSMAEGVQNAAVVVCFMSQQYEASQNCQLELKFAKQTGVAIVPAIVQPPDEAGVAFSARGWLGLLTAGAVWTPLYDTMDSVTFNGSMEALIREIMRAATADIDLDADADLPDPSIMEVKDELIRLHEDTTLPSICNSGTAVLPAVVPTLPVGIRVTAEMEKLLANLLQTGTDASGSNRMGFHGMGGIGKTVVSSWLARQQGVREKFEKVCWVTLGQQPHKDGVQESLYSQLTHKPWDSDASDDMKMQNLQRAFAGQTVLLVLDDCWESKHETWLNFADDTTSSRVLVSSRVSSIVAGSDKHTFIVELKPPSEDDAVRMLLSIGDVAMTEDQIPPEAYELVRFCNLLPLAISIAGQLVKDLQLTDQGSDWRGIVSMMKEEWDQHTIAERLVDVSLKSIRGAQQTSVITLFKSLALLPEDTCCPPEVCVLMYEVGAGIPSSSEEQASMSRSRRVMQVRRWMKCLIDRSIVLGTVDRPQLHDIVRDHVIGLHTEEELQDMHRRFVDVFRDNRPVGPSGEKEWVNTDSSAMSRYIKNNIHEHIRLGWPNEESNGSTVILAWLEDVPQDTIVKAVAEHLGAEELQRMCTTAESTDNKQWTVCKLASLAGWLFQQSKTTAEEHETATVWMQKAVDGLGQLAGCGDTEATLRQQQEQLEIICLERLVLSLLGGSAKAIKENEDRIKLLAHSSAAMRQPAAAAILLFSLSQVVALDAVIDMDPDKIAKFQALFVQYPLFLTSCIRNPESNDQMRQNCMFALHNTGAFQCVLRHAGFDWDTFYGPGGAFLLGAMQEYDFDKHHHQAMSLGVDNMGTGCVAPWVLACHYGEVEQSVSVLEDCCCILERIQLEPNQFLYSMHRCCFGLFCTRIYLTLGCGKVLTDALEKNRCTWIEADTLVDDATLSTEGSFFRARDAPDGYDESTPWFDANSAGWLLKLGHFLAAKSPSSVIVEEVIGCLPSIEAVISMWNGGRPNSISSLQMGQFHLPLTLALACEKCEQFERALEWLELATSSDCSRGGTRIEYVEVEGFTVRGRCLAALARIDEARAAFETAARIAGETGLYLLELIALRDLKLHVDHGQPTLLRMKLVVLRMLGPSPPTEKLDALSSCLAGIRIADVMMSDA